jgi:pyruvate/2-oxoglutarate dehydrogenase complex dihydrolipoamide dehydrogenase (E3) component
MVMASLVASLADTREESMNQNFDAIVIGTGQAGPSLAKRLATAGMRVAIAERHLFGGTCVNTGCIPTKTMVASAYAAHMVRRSADFGVVSHTDTVRVNMAQVKARKDVISGRSRSAVEKMLKTLKNCAVFKGTARFQSPRDVRLGEEVLQAERIFINVGARARIPRIPGLDQVAYLTNSSILDLEVVPDHLVVVGGSYVGLEFAQMFRRFGSEVTVIEKADRLLGREDSDISEAILGNLIDEGINVHLRADCVSVSSDPGTPGRAVIAHFDCEGAEGSIHGTHLLIAVGRQPNTDDLGLDAAGVRRDEHGYIIVDDYLQTNVTGIWALGDCNGKGGFTHTSYNDFEIVASNLLDGEKRSVKDRIPAYALYIDPPLGRAGLTVSEATERGRNVLVGVRPMTRVSRAIEKGETKGLMKIVVDADSQEILGAAILGTGGDEAIHCVLDTMYSRAPYQVLRRAMHIHPTVSELIPTILGELAPVANHANARSAP